jgi:DNA-binding XRE family transcriptional regulator
MKTKAQNSIRELREILGQTQAEFAAMIGASKDTVVSWETGRNKLSGSFAQRIAFATGADEAAMRRGMGAQIYDYARGWRPLTRADFERHRKTAWPGGWEEGARHHLKNCADALRLLFIAAARRGKEDGRPRLPAVLASFVNWCEETRADFGLEEEIREQLMKRTFQIGMTQSYEAWRRMMKDAPAEVKAGFRDDSSKGNEEQLRLELEVMPGWAPGRSMRKQRAVIMDPLRAWK